MPHSIDTSGKLIINFNDFQFIDTIKYKDKIAKLSEIIKNIPYIKYFSLFVIFQDGTKYSLSNMFLWTIPYHTLGYARADADSNPISFGNKSYYIHADTQYDDIQKIILNDLGIKYSTYPIYAIIRKCFECTFVFEAYSNLSIANPYQVYKNSKHLFEEFCINFMDNMVREISDANPHHKYSKILTDKVYRRNVISMRESTEVLTENEIECLQWCRYGKTAEEIGMIMKLSSQTIYKYINSIKNKMDCISITQAVAEAIKYRIIY